MKDIILTESAAQRIAGQLQKRGHGIGLRLAVKESGCSGYAYLMDYAEEQKPEDQVVEAHGVKLFIDHASLPMLQGLRLDYRRDGINEVFKFDNPNAEELCGCGESFTIATPAAETTSS